MLTVQRLSRDDAFTLVEGARKKAHEINVPMCIAIADESGNLIAFERMDGGKVHSSIVAQDKAFTAASTRKGTHELNQLCMPGKPLFGIHNAMGGRICIVAGGLPVIVDGQVVGAIGISSGTTGQDMECAQAGIDYYLG